MCLCERVYYLDCRKHRLLTERVKLEAENNPEEMLRAPTEEKLQELRREAGAERCFGGRT